MEFARSGASKKRSLVLRAIVTPLVGAAMVGILSCSRVPRDPVQLPTDDAVTQRGEQLVRGLASCGFCHGQTRHPDAPLQGGLPWHDRYGEVRAPNITPDRETGIGSLPPAALTQLLRGGGAADERPISLDVHRGYEWMADDDLTAIMTYLRSLPPAFRRVERRERGFYSRNIEGFFESPHEVRGYVPETPRRSTVEYGKYLVDNVARCGQCHNSPEGIFSEEDYLMGGKEIRVDGATKVAPRLKGPGWRGVGGWTEDDILVFFRRGVNPSGKRIDSRFCPIGFYRQASDEDLLAISSFLRSL